MVNCFVVGATGLVGKKLVDELARNPIFTKITLFARRKIDSLEAEKVNQVIVDFDNLEASRSEFINGDFSIGFSCLGTTRAAAGSDAAFIKVGDSESAKMFKETAKATTHFLLLTSQGSNANSFLLYTKTKGRIEHDISTLGFDRVSIFRPSLIVMEKEEVREVARGGENIMLRISSFLGNPHFLSVPARSVAEKMAAVAADIASGVVGCRIFENSDIYKRD